MSKISLGLTAVALLALAVLAGPSSRVVYAQNNAAVVTHECPTDIGVALIGGFLFQYCFDSAVTSSGNGNGSFHGSLLDPTTSPSRAVHISGFGCDPGNGLTTDTELTVTPSGRVDGTCKVHP